MALSLLHEARFKWVGVTANSQRVSTGSNQGLVGHVIVNGNPVWAGMSLKACL